MPVQSDGPGWDQKFVRFEMYNQYCTTIMASVKMFMDADRKRQRNEYPSQPSQPLPISQESDHKAAAVGTTLTQVIGQMGVNSASADEPPDEIYQRHVTFEFQPIMEPEVLVEEGNNDDDDDEDDIFFDASGGSASMDIENQQLPHSALKVEERFLQVHDDVENYSTRYI
jgi:hypothetical protein